MSRPGHSLDMLPHLKQLNEDVLFGEIREQPDLSKRDRSLVTCAILAALHRTAEFDFHVKFALDHGVKKEELIALITHVASCSGCATAVNAGRVALEVLPHDE